MKQINRKNKGRKLNQNHLTLEERKIIQAGIENGSTKAAIARTTGKDAATVAKEIMKHREFKRRNTYDRPVLCARIEDLHPKTLSKKCSLYEEPKCSRRDRSPGACNRCTKVSNCRYDKYFYRAIKADTDYRYTLVDCREGIDLTTKGRDAIAEIIAPLLKNGQSVHQILSAHPEIGKSEKTIYNYIETGVFKAFGVDNFPLKEQVNREQFKDKYKVRKEPANYE